MSRPPNNDFDRWVGEEHSRLVAVLLVSSLNQQRAEAVAESAFVSAAQAWPLPGDGRSKTIWLLRAGFETLSGSTGLSRFGRQDQSKNAEPPSGWDSGLWTQLCGVNSGERTALALRVVAGLAADEADQVTGNRRGLAGESSRSTELYRSEPTLRPLQLELVEAPLALPGQHEALARLADLPPNNELDPSEIRRLAIHQRRRRRAAFGVAAVVVVALLLGASGILGLSDETQRATTATTRATATTFVRRMLQAPAGSLALEPASQLRHGQLVSVDFADVDQNEVNLFQCASDPGLSPERIAALCTLAPFARGAFGSTVESVGLGLHIQRFVRVVDGPKVDCATAPDPCFVLAAIEDRLGLRISDRIGLVGEIATAPLKFENPSSPDSPRLLMTAPRPLVDGTPAQVQGIHFEPGEKIDLMVCSSTFYYDPACSSERIVSVRADDLGRFRVPFLVYRDVPHYGVRNPCSELGTSPKDDCVLQAGSSTSGFVTIRLDFAEPAGPAIQPELKIVTPGPYSRGQSVVVRGSGLQAGETLRITTCNGLNDQSNCESKRSAVRDVTADLYGNFEVPDYRLPTDLPCAPSGAGCLIAGPPAGALLFSARFTFPE